MKQLIPLALAALLLGGCGSPAQPAQSVLPQTDEHAAAGVDCGIVECSIEQEDPDGSEYFTAFAELSAAGRPCFVRVICKSTEGVPISYDLSFDGTAFTCTTEVPDSPFSAPQTETTDWAGLSAVETYENGAFYRSWYLTGDDFDACAIRSEAPDLLLLFRQTLSAAQVQQIECGVYEQTYSGDTDFTARDQFIDLAYTQGVPAHLRLVSYTIEGDPLVTDVSFDGQTYTCVQDTTADRFGAQEVTTTQWPHLVIQPADGGGRQQVWLSADPDRAGDGTACLLFEETGDHPLPALQ